MITGTRCGRVGTLAMLAAVAGFTLLTTPKKAMAQEKTEPAKTSAKEPQPAQAGVKPAQGLAQKGPLQLRDRRAKPPPRVRGDVQRVGKKWPGAIPKPTVVLEPGQVPAIKFDTPVYDFGRMQAGPDVVHDFWFANTGNGPLEILKVKGT